MKKQYVWESWMANQHPIKKNNARGAFTLLEVLISIALLGIMLPALFSAVDMLKDSNEHLFEYLEKSKKSNQSDKSTVHGHTFFRWQHQHQDRGTE